MRRLLHMSGDEWRALPWHDQRAYREGLVRELTGEQPVRTPASESDELGHLADIGFTIT